MEKKNVTIYYGLIVALNSVGFVTMSAFSSVYLLDAVLSNGAGRCLGSLGYAAGSYFFGLISVACGPKSIPTAFLAAFFIFGVLVYIYPVETPKDIKS